MGEKATEVEIKAEEVAEASGELVVINALTNINQLTEKQALGLLRGRYKGIVVDYTTAEGDKTARRLRGELVSIRTSGNKKRLELNRKRLEENKKCNEAFGRIETVVKELEDPYDKGIEAEEEKAKAIKEGRGLDAIWARAKEHAIKLALCGHEDGEISAAVMEWAITVVNYSVANSIASIQTRLSDNQQEADTKWCETGRDSERN